MSLVAPLPLAGEGGTRVSGRVRVAAQLSKDFFLDAVGIRENVVVPESDDPPTATLKPNRSAFVIGIIRMLPAIGLNNQTVLEANEVHDE